MEFEDEGNLEAEKTAACRATIEIIKSQEAELSNVGQIQKEDHGLEEDGADTKCPYCYHKR